MPEWVKTLLQYLILESTQDSSEETHQTIEEILKNLEDK